ncbi:MAG: ABC transporter substrate-binding protein [Candidatus Odyssella sp.]|nr:ABC transporter substrate-binding protein [Candidatus Odyssella sp.]
MRRREVVSLLAAMGAGLPGFARGEARLPRIGLLGSQPLQPIRSFKAKLSALGHVEGGNLAFAEKWAQGRDDRYPALAAELAALPADVVVAWGTPAALAAKRASTSIPTVFVAGDAVNTGVVSNLARPEANVTGVIAINVQLEEKRLDLLKEVVPNLRRVAVLANSLNPLNTINLETTHRVARDLALAIEVFEVRSSAEIGAALQRLIESRPDAALLASDILLLSNRKQIAETMAAHRIPAIYPFREYRDSGGFIIYGANISVLFERAAEYVDRILKGAKPGSLPVQQATAFELIVNLKAAAGLGLRVPSAVQVRADEVIE